MYTVPYTQQPLPETYTVLSTTAAQQSSQETHFLRNTTVVTQPQQTSSQSQLPLTKLSSQTDGQENRQVTETHDEEAVVKPHTRNTDTSKPVQQEQQQDDTTPQLTDSFIEKTLSDAVSAAESSYHVSMLQSPTDEQETEVYTELLRQVQGASDTENDV